MQKDNVDRMRWNKSSSSLALIQISKGFHNILSEGCGETDVNVSRREGLFCFFSLLETDDLFQICSDEHKPECHGISAWDKVKKRGEVVDLVHL